MLNEPTKKMVADIRVGVCHAYIEARVAHLWKVDNYKNPGKGDYHSIEMILVDENENVIQATIVKCLIFMFGDKIKDGHSYKISKFQSVYNQGNNVAVPHTCRLRFASRTTVEEIQIESMPTYGFKFVTFKDVIDNKLDGRDLIDVIGNVDECHPINEKDNYWNTKVDISDQSQEQLPFWLWGPYVVEAKNIAREKYSLIEKPIVALQCVHRIATRDGRIILATKTNTSKIYINPNIEEVQQLRASISKYPSPKGIVTSHNKSILHGICKPLRDILNDWKAGKFVTTAYITEIDATFKWYKNVCKQCSTRAEFREDGKWHCSKEYCQAFENGNDERVTRFKVRYFIEDTNGNQAQIMMSDELITKKVNKTSLECLDTLRKNGDKYGVPKELTLLLEKEYVLQLEVHRRYNLEQNSTCYKVLDFCDKKEIIEEWKQQNKTIEDINITLDDAPAQVIIDEEKAQIIRKNTWDKQAAVSASRKPQPKKQKKLKIHI